MKPLKYILLFFILALVAPELNAQIMAPEEMPNVQVADGGQYVSDPAGLMSAETKSRINSILSNLRDKTTVEAAVAIVPEISDETTIEEWSEKLFTGWGIGKSDKDNGVLLVISPGSRIARIQTGYGTEGALPDIVCGEIIRSLIAPEMKKGNLDGAALAATQEIAKVISDPAYAEELRSSRQDGENALTDADHEKIKNTFYLLIFAIFIATTVWFFVTLFKNKKKNHYQKALIWRSDIRTALLFTILSAGSGVIYLILVYLLYRRNRLHRRRCQTCGHRMKRLNEAQDNAYLQSQQDTEERIGSVDYDVWLCPQCGDSERYAFPLRQSKFETCKACGAKALEFKGEKVTQWPTRRLPGKAVRIYECRHCHNKEIREKTLPRKDDDGGAGAALAAGAILGSLGRGGGGGGFGGGFGGGATGGGGASGGW